MSCVSNPLVGKPQEHVRSGEGLLQGTIFRLGELGFRGVQVNAPGMNQPLGVKHIDMFAAHSQRHVELGARNAGGPGPDDDDLHILQLAARQLGCVQKGGAGDHRRSMLVVMEHREYSSPDGGVPPP